MDRAGKVYIQNIYAGRIYETDEGYGFSYNKEYLEREGAVPVSLTMPLTAEEYESKVLFPFFDGLIPEGWLLGVVERNWKIDGKDRFGLMLSSCRDCIGDVWIEADI
jgi:serine/threonine-protein kinase HipA